MLSMTVSSYKRIWLVGWAIIGSLQSQAACANDAAGKEAELKKVRSRIESIRASLHSEAERRDSLAAQLKDAEMAIQSARQQLAQLRAQRMAAENRLRALQSERNQTRQAIAAQRAALAGELRVAYMNGRHEHLKLLLNQQDPIRLGRMLTYYGYFGRARVERITLIEERLAHLDLIAEQIVTENAKLKGLEVQNSGEIKVLADSRARRAQTLAVVQTRLNSRAAELSKLEGDARALEKLVAELRRAIEELPGLAEQSFQRAKGRLLWPLQGEVLAHFGQSRAGGPLKWQGMLIGAPRGTQVRAAHHGRVLYADWLPGLGLLIVVDHGGGYMSLYGHNEQLYRRVGDKVASGDILSAVGDAAGVGKPAVYLEIRKGRQPLDPKDWLMKP